MNSKVRRTTAVLALGVGVLALDLAAIRGISASWDAWSQHDPVRAVAKAGTLVAREVSALVAERVGDAAMSVALLAVRESGDLFGVIERVTPALQAAAPAAAAAPAERATCMSLPSPSAVPAPVGTSRVDAVVVVAKCSKSHDGTRRVEWQQVSSLSRRAL